MKQQLVDDVVSIK